MLARVLKDLYGRLPVIRDLLQISESVQETRELSREITGIANEIRTLVWQTLGNVTHLRAANAIRILDFELHQDPRYGDPKRLPRSFAQVCSQNGEDGMIQEIFHRIGIADHVFAEVGVGDGQENNTAFLLSQGWNGFWIDGTDQFLRTIENRPDLQDGCLKSAVSFVSKENIANVFGKLGVPKEFDLLSLDIDQNTFYAWEGLSEFRPRVVVVEYNASIPPDVDWKVRYDPQRTWDGDNNFGASLLAFELLGRRLGYSLVGCDFVGVNAFFVRDDLVDDLFAAPFTAANHYEPPRYAMLHRRGHRSVILDRIDNL